MLKAVLLDLDNTLILFDELKYYEAYFAKLNRFFSDDFAPEELRSRVINGTLALSRNTGAKNNRTRFMKVFAGDREAERERLWARFMTFYREVYADIDVTVALPEGLQAGMDRLRQTGLQLVIASNPIFPVIAQEMRMRWGNLEPTWFSLFTHIENMHYVKPMADYYHQTCDLIGAAPAECLMVGNDPVNDMSAARAGLKTYRTTDAEVVDYASLTLTEEQRKKSPRDIPEPDYTGPFAGVADVVERMMK